MEPQTENYTGADCTGGDGDINRTLTLANTGTTSPGGFLVYVDGSALSLAVGYTVVHNETASVITFLGALADSSNIIVNYYQNTAVGIGTDFETGPYKDFGTTVTRTPVTMTTNFSGNKTYTDGTPEEIQVVFENPNQKFMLDKEGLTKVYDARLFCKPGQAMSKYDKIAHNSKVYRVETVNERRFNGTAMFKTVTLFYINDS